MSARIPGFTFSLTHDRGKVCTPETCYCGGPRGSRVPRGGGGHSGCHTWLWLEPNVTGVEASEAEKCFLKDTFGRLSKFLPIVTTLLFGNCSLTLLPVDRFVLVAWSTPVA